MWLKRLSEIYRRVTSSGSRIFWHHSKQKTSSLLHTAYVSTKWSYSFPNLLIVTAKSKGVRFTLWSDTYIQLHTDSYIQTVTYIQLHTYSYIHKVTYIQLLTYSYLHTVAYIQFHTYSYIHTYIHACMHACVHTYSFIHTVTYIHTYVHTYIHTYIHTCIHTYIHTYRRAYRGAYTYAQMNIQRSMWFSELHCSSHRFLERSRPVPANMPWLILTGFKTQVINPIRFELQAIEPLLSELRVLAWRMSHIWDLICFHIQCMENDMEGWSFWQADLHMCLPDGKEFCIVSSQQSRCGVTNGQQRRSCHTCADTSPAEDCPALRWALEAWYLAIISTPASPDLLWEWTEAMMEQIILETAPWVGHSCQAPACMPCKFTSRNSNRRECHAADWVWHV